MVRGINVSGIKVRGRWLMGIKVRGIKVITIIDIFMAKIALRATKNTNFAPAPQTPIYHLGATPRGCPKPRGF